MRNKQNIVWIQLGMAIIMFLISIFMTISYYYKISGSEPGKLSIIAFYVWIFSIFGWLIKVIYDTRKVKKLKNKIS